MVDRETRILEIAKDMCFQADHCAIGAKNKCCALNCETTWLAEKLVDKNYQKINPDDIVISKTDYDRLKLLSEINTDLKQLGTSVEEALSINSSDIAQVEKYTCKATVEKCIQILEEMRVPEDGRHEWRDRHNDTLDRCKARLAKEFKIKG